MMYLSQLLGKPIYFHGKPFAKIIDLAINEHETEPSVAKIEVSKQGKKMTISADDVLMEDRHIQLLSDTLHTLSHEQKDFYLSEDLLDKQVIDIDGRRLVRVNDIVLDNNGQLKVKGLDVGIGGILRRLGLGRIKVTNKILPWKVIEAFDYETGNIRIKLTQNSLNTFHPAEIADILEDVGTKERLGIVSSLTAYQAAQAIEESDEETQVSILEGLTPTHLKEVLNKMHIAEIADVFHDVNPLRLAEIQQILGTEKLQKVKGLLRFPDNVAGGLMHESFFTVEHDILVEKIKEKLSHQESIPEIALVTDNEKFLGTFLTKDLIKFTNNTRASLLISDTNAISTEDNFSDIIELFSQYNLRGIPVLDKNDKPIGVVFIDDVFKVIEEENQRDET